MKRFFPWLAALLFLLLQTGAGAAAAPDYSSIDAIFSHYCLDCHSATDPDGKLVLENYPSLMKGGESGAVILPGQSDSSTLLRMVKGSYIKEGRQLIMPPGRKRSKLTPEEISLLAAWIDAGALAPAVAKSAVVELSVPMIKPHGSARDPINALAHIPSSDLIAVARYQTVELRSAKSGRVERILSGHHGNVNALAVSTDGKRLYSGAGENALFGEIKSWNVADGKLLKTFVGHKDAIYALALSPDGQTLASGSYDQKIKLWKTETGEEMKTLKGHNGCVFGLAFRPDGKILASASGDHTVKLWDVASGTRRDTFSQPLKEVFCVAFTPDGKKLAAGGVDNRIRVWQISSNAVETTNPLLESKFAAEGAILRLVFSPDGKYLLSSADDSTVRLWDPATWTERLSLPKQPDWASGLDFVDSNRGVAVGRLDGTLAFYDLEGKPLKMARAAASKKMKKKNAPPPDTGAPIVSVFWPRGLQFGTTIPVKIEGKNLGAITQIKTSSPLLTGRTILDTNDAGLTIELTAVPKTSRGDYTVTLVNVKGESTPVHVYVGHLPHVFEQENHAPGQAAWINWPASYWGTLNPGGDMDDIAFHALAGQTLVFDLAAGGIGSKAEAHLTLLDKKGSILATGDQFEGGDPLLNYSFSVTGDYRLRISEATDQGSPDHFYRVTIGALPEVAGVFPPSVQTNATARIQLLGYNLEGENTIEIRPTHPGALALNLDPNKYRFRRPFQINVTEEPERIETEPNNTPAQANSIPVPCTISGQIAAATNGLEDVDYFRFNATAGEQLILETDAARLGSPLDTRLEILFTNGQPVPRLQLQAVRDSAVNFRGIESGGLEIRIDNWQEMELNQYLYMEGEVCRLFRAPRGPDSGFEFYSSGGKRRDYFDTTAADHALDEPCYIVVPHAPGEKLTPNGLPIFPIYYANDDDADRQFGTDSRLHFTAPATGPYLVKVSDNRGRNGPLYVYRLTIRQAQPDFSVSMQGDAPTLSPGSGKEFGLTANRVDHFDEDIEINVTGLPPGFHVSAPLIIQAGHDQALGTINCDSNSVTLKAAEMAKIKITATAVVNGKTVARSVNTFSKINVGGAGSLLVSCEPYDATDTNFTTRSLQEKPLEMTLVPGQRVPAWIKVQRHGENGLVTFSAQNLPHGVIVDDIGLNGVLMRADEDRREIFLHAERWVPETDRYFFIKAAQAGEPTSQPVLLHIRHSPVNQTASASP